MTALTGSLVWIIFLFIGNYLPRSIGADSLQGGQGAEDYLRKFGYFGSHTAGALMGEDAVTKALKDFQRFAGLNQTGVLDAATVVMMNTPRCGVPDVFEDSPSVRRKRYALHEHRWNKPDLKYRILKYSGKLNSTLVDIEIRKAFDFWSNVSVLEFTQITRGRANINIRFERGIHGDRARFDGPGGTPAHTYFPNDPYNAGDIHFDDDEPWTINKERGMDLLYTAVHEIGHSLGILHSDIKEAIMFPIYNKDSKISRLHEDDIQAIQALYGARELPAETIDDDVSGPRPDVSNAPDLCTDAVIDTITRTNGSTYAFRGYFYWRITPSGIAEGYPRKISDDWSGLEGNLDASLTWANNKTYFFKGKRYWRFTNKYMDRGYPKLLKEGFEGVPDNLDAAFRWSGNGKIYFFKGNQFWRYDDGNDPPVSDKYPKEINYWNGLPNNIDAAFQYEDNKTYFFYGQKYYKFDDESFKVEESKDDPFPRSTAEKWFHCPSS